MRNCETIQHIKRNFTIFYPWQSDLPLTDNKSLIARALDKAVKKVEKGNEVHTIEIDRDTKNTAGSVDMAKYDLQKN